tara:strand:+ start:3939 stop:4127 length:189 start_codon:yes stop_codon:yes gene_type:complete
MKHSDLQKAYAQGAKVQKFIPCGTDENMEGGVWLATHNPQWEEGTEYRLDPDAPENWLEGMR